MLVQHSDEILHPIIKCFQRKESSVRVRLAAGNALLSSLECAYKQFECEVGNNAFLLRVRRSNAHWFSCCDVQKDRSAIVQVVCDSIQSSEVDEAVLGLQILVKLGSFYYHHLQHYIEAAVAPVTVLS